ncbi:MAG TPA: hypothetical protein VKN76_16995 [Kiloniellaceae bacterium]|nr:hypothetical protein [Kiloniellaceae bacterium]
MSLRSLLRAACFVAVVALLAGFTWASFQPKVRYNVPSDDFGKRMSCLYHLIYEWEGDAQVLVFGTSRTGAAISAPILAGRATAASGAPVVVAKMSLAGANPGLSYQIFQEYLTQHAAPDLVIFEAEQVRTSPSVVPYVNRFFTITATPDLYLDVAAGPAIQPLPQRIADALRLLIDHYDKSLSKALSPLYGFSLTETTCTKSTVSKAPLANADFLEKLDPAAEDYEEKLKTKAMAVLERAAETAEKKARRAVKKGIRTTAQKQGLLDESFAAHSETWETEPVWDWHYTTPAAERYFDYYRRFVDWAAANDGKVVFLRFPSYLEPPSTAAQRQAFEAQAGAPVLVPDVALLRELYPLYRDSDHMNQAAWATLADWIVGELRDRSMLPGQ